MSINEVLLNIILVGIPEELFMTLIALLIMGRYDYIDKYSIKTNLTRIMLIVVIPCSIIYSINLNFLQMGFYVRILFNLSVFFTSITIMLKGKDIFKILFATMISFGILMLTEILTGLMLVYVLNFDSTVINVSAWNNFIIFLPNRIIHFGLIYIFYLKKNAWVNINIRSIWRENSYFRWVIFICSFITIVMALLIYNNFALKNCIKGLPGKTQLFIVITLFTLLILNMIIPWVTLVSIYPREKYRNKIREGEENYELTN